MLLFLVVLALVVVLFAANMEHRSSFSYLFGRLEDVPVFMALLVAFIAGALIMLPFTIGPHRHRRRKQKGRRGQPRPGSGRRRSRHRTSALRTRSRRMRNVGLGDARSDAGGALPGLDRDRARVEGNC